MAMNMNNLKIFINVADAGNLTRAAEALYISQPSVSKAIKNIENDLGVSLFHRDKKNGISLTDIGEKILDYARQMMLMEEKIYQTAYLSRNLLEGTLKIASIPSGTAFFLINALSAFKKQYPQVHIDILEGSSDEVNRMVLNHTTEFGISIAPCQEFNCKTLLEDHIVAISKESLNISSIDLKTSRQEFFVCKSALDSISSVLEDKRIKTKARFKIADAGTVRKMAEHGIGIGLQAASLLTNESDLYQYPVEPHISTDLILISNSFDSLSFAAEAFINLL